MNSSDTDQHISEVCTRWSQLVHPDHEIPRYYGPVYRYLLGVTRDPVTARELANDFAVRFLEGKFQRAKPENGRLRDLIKRAARNLAIDFWRKKQKEKVNVPLDNEQDLLARGCLAGEETEDFESACRDDLLTQVWNALDREEQASGKPFFTVLRFKVAHPDMRSAEMARQVGALLNKPLSDDAIRQMLHRARGLFAESLLQAVGRMVGTCDPQVVENELIDLNLLDYCKSALERRKAEF